MALNENKTLDFTFEVKELNEDGSFEGWLSTFGNVDDGGDVVEKGAFKKTLKENKGTFPLLWQHDPRSPIGSFKAEERPEGLWIAGTLLVDGVRQAKEAYALMKAGVVKGLSIGFRTVLDQMKDGVRYLKELKLMEGSVVTFPMNRLAGIVAVKADFAEERDAVMGRAKPGLTVDALHSTLHAILESGMERDEVMASVSDAVDNFKSAYLESVPAYLELKGLPNFEFRQRFMTAGELEAMKEIASTFAAVGTSTPAGGTEKSAVPTGGKAADTSEEEVASALLRIADKYQPAAGEAA